MVHYRPRHQRTGDVDGLRIQLHHRKEILQNERNCYFHGLLQIHTEHYYDGKASV